MRSGSSESGRGLMGPKLPFSFRGLLRSLVLLLGGSLRGALVAWAGAPEAMWCGVVWCGVVWCGVVWCGVVWCGVVWCGVVLRCVVLCWVGLCCVVLCCDVFCALHSCCIRLVTALLPPCHAPLNPELLGTALDMQHALQSNPHTPCVN